MKLYRNINPYSQYYGHLGFLEYTHSRGKLTVHFRIYTRNDKWSIIVGMLNAWEEVNIKLDSVEMDAYVISHNSLL